MGQGKRARLTYERMAALVSDAPASNANAGSLTPIKRIQSIDYGFDVNKKTIKQMNSYEFVKSAPDSNGIKRLPSVTQPTVDLNIKYFFSSGENEEAIGFSPVGQMLQADYNAKKTPGYKDDINIIILGSKASSREDIIESGVNLSGFDVLGFGNAYLTQYSYNAAVGQFPECQLSYKCSNASFDIYDGHSAIQFPSVNPQNTNEMKSSFFSPNPVSGIKFKDAGFKELNEVSVIKPGEIKVDVIKNDPQGFSTLVLDSDDVAIQSANITLDFARSDVQGLGNSYVFDRKIKYPVVGSLSLEYILREFNTDTKLENVFSHDSDYTVKLTHLARDPSTTGNMYASSAVWESFDIASMQIDHAKLKSENFSASIGDSATVSTNFVFEVTPVTGMSFVYKDKVPPVFLYDEIKLEAEVPDWGRWPNSWVYDTSLFGTYKLIDSSYYELQNPPPNKKEIWNAEPPIGGDYWWTDTTTSNSINPQPEDLPWEANAPYAPGDIVQYNGHRFEARRNMGQPWYDGDPHPDHKIAARIYYRGEGIGWRLEGRPNSIANANWSAFVENSSALTPCQPGDQWWPDYCTNDFFHFAQNNSPYISQDSSWTSPYNGSQVHLKVIEINLID